MDFYGPVAKLVKASYRCFHLKWKVEYQQKEEAPVVYIVHHQNMKGPLHAMGLLPVEAHIWALHVFTDKKECFHQYYTYTFSKRYGWPRPVAYIVAKVAALAIPGVINSFRAIPVHRDAAAIGTLRQSLVALMQGHNLLLCPNEDYASTSAEMKDIYSGFLDMEKLYHKKTGAHLPFVPVYCSRRQRTLVVGKALRFADGDFKVQREEMANALKNAVNALGRECGDI